MSENDYLHRNTLEYLEMLYTNHVLLLSNIEFDKVVQLFSNMQQAAAETYIFWYLSVNKGKKITNNNSVPSHCIHLKITI